MLFKETLPARDWSNIPLWNMLIGGKYADNNWVMVEQLPGKGQHYITTDSAYRFPFNMTTL